MRYLKLLLLLPVLLCCGLAPAQSTHTLSGKLLDGKTGQPVIAARLSLLNDSGRVVVPPVLSDTTGFFSLAVQDGTYRLKMDALGYQVREIQNLLITADTLLGSLYLNEDAMQLGPVDIVAETSDLELKGDKKVFNVGKDILSKGGNATDVLGNVPSVNVDPSGNVSLRGNGNVRVLIDGKPSMLTADNGLRQIPAASIERVEVINNPSASSEAQGTAGIINIVLKKNKQYGFNASLQGGLGNPANHSVNANMSYKTKKVNVFANMGYRYHESFTEEKIYRLNYGEGNIPDLHQLNHGCGSNQGGNIYIGGDYYINDKNTLTGSYYHTRSVSRDTTRYNYQYTGGAADSTITRLENYREPKRFNQLELNHVKTFDTEGKKWTTSMQYHFWNDDENENIVQQTLYPYSTYVSKLVTNDIESSKDIYVQSDFVTPLKNKARFEAGGRAALRAIRSEYIATLDDVVLDRYNNKLNYDENIYGAYMQYGSKLKGLSYLLGLRAEFSNIHIGDRIGSFDKTKNYINLFPTLHLQYGFEKNLDVQLSYSRRINRPHFFQLNPFGGLSDMRSLTVGNPDLDPMYTHVVELGALKKAGKLTLNPAVYYQHSTNYFEYILQQDANGFFVLAPVNLSLEKRYGAELSLTYKPVGWWRLSADINGYAFEQRGEYAGRIYSVANSTWFATFRSGIKLPKIVSVDFSLNYQAANKNVQSVIKQQYRANAGVSRDFWGDKLSVTFTVNNLFDSRIYHQITQTDTYYLDAYSHYLNRQYTLTLVYRFNRKKGEADRMPASGG